MSLASPTASTRYSMANTYLKLNQPQLAREQFYQCLAVKPENEDYAAGLAEALLACNEREELITFLTREARDRGRSGDYLRWAATSSNSETSTRRSSP